MSRTISVRVDDEVTVKLDEIAKTQDRDRSYIVNKAITEYIDLYNWQLEQIDKGLEQLENGEVLTQAEGEAVFQRLFAKLSK